MSVATQKTVLSGQRTVEELRHNILLHPLHHIPLHFLYSHIRSHENPSPLSNLSKYHLHSLHMPDSTTNSFITSVKLKHGLIGVAPVHIVSLLYSQFIEISNEKHCSLGQIISWLFPTHSVNIFCYCVFIKLQYELLSPGSLLSYKKERLHYVQTGILPTNITRLSNSMFLKAVHPPNLL